MRTRRRRPPRTMRRAAESNRSRLGSQARAGPSRASICIQAVGSQAIATGSVRTLSTRPILQAKGTFHMQTIKVGYHRRKPEASFLSSMGTVPARGLGLCGCAGPHDPRC